MKNILNGICVGLAFLCVGLGAVGIVLPFLPTTPFFLVAAALFAKGSKRFHRWFTGTAIYRKHLEPFVESKSMTMKKKLSVLAMVTALLTIGFIMSPIWHARVVIVIVALAHYYIFFFRIKTAPAGESSEAADSADSPAVSWGPDGVPVCGCSAESSGTAGRDGHCGLVPEPREDITPVQSSAGGHEAGRDSDGLPVCGCSVSGDRSAGQDGCGGSASASGDDMKPVQRAGASSAAAGGLSSDDQDIMQPEGSRCSGVAGIAEKGCGPAETGHARIREATGDTDRMPPGGADRYRERRMEKGEENVS